ncbi:MAG: transglutaminase domain-containing protein [Candidatus Marinimicrobia bacterium]|nr:transglutaminase domain-containing protein [Candidatus Neomarinimicrobiota bacterium]MBL7011002.1 transglutaminase domain-containing protein [Candidatus Neomarinimicrobiota bacterium]MBL7031326.1 transglutaminase domain-containing protein [Candidatus Neomarinimicrobiota bacterium]
MSSLRNIKIEGKSNPAELNTTQCLLSDEWIDHEHPTIINKAKELTVGMKDDWEKINAIFEFIRDEIVYNFAPVIESETDWKASSVLKQKNGMCHQKSNLQVALFRAVGIPAGLTYQSAIDYPLLKTRYKEMIPDGVLAYHALGVVHVDGKWFRMDATLDSGLCDRRGYQLTQVNKGEETLLPKTKKNGDPHFEMIKDHGYFEAYPEVFVDSFTANIDKWKYWRSFVRKEHLSM